MESIARMLGRWLALTWGILGTGAWAFNGVSAVTSDAEPSLDVLLFALALTVTGVTLGITFSVVAGLIWSGASSRQRDGGGAVVMDAPDGRWFAGVGDGAPIRRLAAVDHGLGVDGCRCTHGRFRSWHSAPGGSTPTPKHSIGPGWPTTHPAPALSLDPPIGPL